MPLTVGELQTTDLRALREWIIRWVAGELGVRPQEVDCEAAFDDMGLSSIQAVSMAGELEEMLGLKVDPDVAWEFPTIAQLVAHLAISNGMA